MARFEIDMITLSNNEDGKKVLSALKEVLAKHGYVTYADLLNLCDLKCTYKDTKIIWTDLSEATVREYEDRYILKMPAPVSIVNV